MMNKEIEKYEQELTKLTKALVGKEHSDLTSLYQRIRNLAAEIPAPLSNVDILNAEIRAAKTTTVGMEGICGELINNIHRALQTKMMLNACVSAEKSCKLAKWSCFWAATAAIISLIAAIAAYVSIFVMLCTK
jgi:hypothetical protein